MISFDLVDVFLFGIIPGSKYRTSNPDTGTTMTNLHIFAHTASSKSFDIPMLNSTSDGSSLYSLHNYFFKSNIFSNAWISPASPIVINPVKLYRISFTEDLDIYPE